VKVVPPADKPSVIQIPGAAVARGALTVEEQVNIAVYETSNRGVVNIDTKGTRTDGFFFTETPTEGSGSGSVLDKQGHILTNFHVVDGAQSIEVTLASGNTFPAQLLGHDLTDDVAVLKVSAPAEELHPVVLGESGELKVGQRVFAIGNPFGLERTLTVGIVSSLNRSLPSRRGHHFMKSMIQVDAAMNPGNSGGPLIDSSGRVIGMNTAIASKTGQNTGVGFAIPVNRIRRIVPELIAHGHVARAELGVSQVMVTERGLLVAAVADDGPAAKAGLQGFKVVRKRQQRGPFVYETQTVDRNSADLITHVDGQAIRTVEDLLGLVEEKRPGQQVELTIIRANQPLKLKVTLGDGES
jgi:S1-C subfamily serine protease